MKSLSLIFLLAVLTAGFAGAQTKPDCVRNVSPGGVTMCLPALDGMQESYTNEDVKALVDASDGAGNYILGVYLPDSLYARIDRIRETALDNHFKIYMTRASLSLRVTPDMLKQVEKEFKQQLKSEKWEDIKKRAEEANAERGISIGQPTIVETTHHGINAISYQILIPIQQGSTAITAVANLSQVILHNRLVWIAYYTRYVDESTLAMSKQRGLEMLRKMQFANL